MRKLLVVLGLGIFVFTVPTQAADLNGDGVDDSYISPSIYSSLEVGDIAVIDTEDGSVGTFLDRIGGLGYSITTIPLDSTLETWLNYSIIILPVGHANLTNYATFDALADDLHMYVNSGGGLWVGQPNPYQMPSGTADITWVPYALTLQYEYNESDCPPEVSDATHCITQGLPSTIFSFPADNAISYADDWQVLVVGNTTNRPGVMFAEYGSGKVLVEFSHPSPFSGCPIDDAALQRYLECLDSGTVAISEINWGSLKANFR